MSTAAEEYLAKMFSVGTKNLFDYTKKALAEVVTPKSEPAKPPGVQRNVLALVQLAMVSTIINKKIRALSDDDRKLLDVARLWVERVHYDNTN